MKIADDLQECFMTGAEAILFAVCSPIILFCACLGWIIRRIGVK